MGTMLVRYSAAVLLVASTALTVGGCARQGVEDPLERQTVETSDTPDTAADVEGDPVDVGSPVPSSEFLSEFLPDDAQIVDCDAITFGNECSSFTTALGLQELHDHNVEALLSRGYTITADESSQTERLVEGTGDGVVVVLSGIVRDGRTQGSVIAFVDDAPEQQTAPIDGAGYGVDQLPGTENYVDHTFAQFVIRLPRDYERVDERSTAVTNTDEYAADSRPTILLVEALTADDSQFLEDLSGGCVELSFRDVPADNPSLIMNTYSVDGDVCGGQDFVVYQIFDSLDEIPLGAVVFLDRNAVDTTEEGIVRSITRNN